MPHYWERFAHGNGVPPGEDLAAMRRGAGRAAGSVPDLWRFYSVPDSGGRVPGPALVAEHHALVLFGFHQQGQHAGSAHVAGRSLAEGLRELRRRSRYHEREESLDARVAAAATATTVEELAWHLRALVRLLRDEGIGFDYTRLWRDLLAWQQPGGPERVRRAWGRDYFAWGEEPARAGDADADDAHTHPEETTDD